MFKIQFFLKVVLSFILFVLFNTFALAAAPSGDDFFQLLTSHTTGGDNTGDGGTGLPNDLNYYYVGQTFTAAMQIKANSGSSAANIWIDYTGANVLANNLSTGSFFPTWSGQTIAGDRVKSTGYRVAGYSTGLGSFGSVNFTMLRPTAAAYGTGSPDVLDINTGVIGATTESNISRDGVDVLDDAEDFFFHIWADIVKPYAANPLPLDTAVAVAVDDLYKFELCDSKDGEIADAGTCLATGVGTGVNTSTPPGVLTFDDGLGAVDYTGYDAYSCSGVWGTNDCDVDVNPPSPLGISGDQRNWKYDTLYTVNIDGYEDLASPAQDQLGDANGPNVIDQKVWTFTTEADTVAPQVVNEIPARGSVGNSVDTNITVDVLDKKFYPGNISGVGLDSTTCKFNVSSPTFAFTTYSSVSAEMTVIPIDYGYRFVIDPATNFGQDETVAVSVYDCEDLAGNTMIVDNYTFDTADTTSPYVDNENPADDAAIAVDGLVTFDISDTGVGVDLNTAVIIVGDQVYTNGGGAGLVTVNGTRITYSDSLDFNGGNFVGDLTSLAGASDKYSFVIDVENDFLPGEAVPVLIYASDFSNNLMERVVYTLVVDGAGVCPVGSTYCGADSVWDGSACVGNAGVTCGANTTLSGAECVSTCSSGGSGGGGGVLFVDKDCDTPDPIIKYVNVPVEVETIKEVPVDVIKEMPSEIVYRDKIIYKDRVIYKEVDAPVSDDVGGAFGVVAEVRKINDSVLHKHRYGVDDILNVNAKNLFVNFSGVAEPLRDLTLLVY